MLAQATCLKLRERTGDWPVTTVGAGGALDSWRRLRSGLKDQSINHEESMNTVILSGVRR